MSNRQLRLGAILQGVGMTQDGWKQPGVPSNASIAIDWYKDGARRAEAATFDFVFIVDSPYITPDSAPQFLLPEFPPSPRRLGARSSCRAGRSVTGRCRRSRPLACH